MISFRRCKRGAFQWTSDKTGRVYVMAPAPGKRWLLMVDGQTEPHVFRTMDDAALAALSSDVVREAEMIVEAVA